jgi:hypothetical protein
MSCQAVRNNQRTARQAMTEKGWERTSVLSTYVSYVEVNGETRAYKRLE